MTVLFLDPEEQQLEEEEYDYMEELGDNQFIGATSHQPCRILIGMQMNSY